MKNLTSNQFENILDDNENENENDALNQQFCKSFDGFRSLYQYYTVESLTSSIVKKYELMYQDFLSINNELINGELKNLLLKHSSSEQDVDFLYNKIMIRRRNVCCLLPFKHCKYDWKNYGQDYISLINRLNRNRNDKLKMYCILYNCMISIFVAGDNGDGGLDQYIYKYNKNGNDVSTLCEWYILIAMVKSGIFGNDKKLVEPETYHYEKDVYSSSIVSFVIKHTFNNDLTSFKKLLKCCVQDIKYNNDLKKLKDIYTLNSKYDEYGIQFFVLNRVTYYIYHDLLCISMNNDSQLLFPSLSTFYKFMYNFSVYCHCHTHGVAKEYQGLLCDVLFV